jgi:hypothetical protein
MNPSKKFTLLISAMLLTAFSYAQTVSVKKEPARVKGENTDGYEVMLEGAVTDVTTALVKFLKATGKVKQSPDLITVGEPTFQGIEYGATVYAVTKEKGKSAAAWLGIKPAEWPKEDVDKIRKELEKMLHDFGVQFYRGKIQLQIDESNRAAQAVEKQQQRLVNENKSLNTKLEDNKREKIQLEKSLANNKLQYETLLKRIAKNKHDQDSVAVAGGQIKKVVEMHKEKQKKVN